jgi:hypothetical protein
MSLLSELTAVLDGLNVPVETGVFSEPAPDRYAVLTPIVDVYDAFADNAPGQDVEEVRISLFDKGNYLSLKKRIEKAVLSAEITITERRYIGRDDATGYHHYAVDTAKNYEIQEE